MKFDHRHYVPVLKGKRAEFPALKALKTKAGITPLIEAVPTAPINFIAKQMSSAWPGEQPYFVDYLFLDDEDMEESEADNHPIWLAFQDKTAKDQKGIPITGTARSPAYQSAVKRILSEQKREAAVRLVPDDYEDEDQLLEAIEALLEYLDVEPGQLHLLLDADTVFGRPTAEVAQSHRAKLEITPRIEEWRTLTVLAGAFPLSLAPLDRDKWNVAPRADWRGWNAVIKRPRSVSRLPAYGDYTIAHPDLPPSGRATILAQLRYTGGQDFLIWKGHNVFTHKDGFKQFFRICSSIIEHDEWKDKSFSDGAAEIYGKATKRDSPGNAESWRRIGVNHHLEMVMEQIANLP